LNANNGMELFFLSISFLRSGSNIVKINIPQNYQPLLFVIMLAEKIDNILGSGRNLLDIA